MIAILRIDDVNRDNARKNGFKIEYIIKHGVGLIFSDPNLGDIAEQMIGLSFDSPFQDITCVLDPITHLMINELSTAYACNYSEIVNIGCYIFNAILEKEHADIQAGKYKNKKLPEYVDQYLDSRKAMKELI